MSLELDGKLCTWQCPHCGCHTTAHADWLEFAGSSVSGICDECLYVGDGFLTEWLKKEKQADEK